MEKFKLAPQYQWLLLEPGPKILLEFMKIYGTLESPGNEDNPEILAWAKEVGLSKTYNHDSIAWCGLVMALVMRRAGKEVVDGPLWALNWAKAGTKVLFPMLGDILTFQRKGGGHVGMYVGEDKNCYHVLGGNQGDKVCITRIVKTRLFQARRPIYTVTPINIRKVMLSDKGTISTNEQ